MSELPLRIGRYELVEEVGSGGFATVYRAMDTLLEREVALKLMRPLLMSDPSFVKRFQREAKTAAGFDHPNVVPILDYGEADNRLFLVMKYMDAGSLEDRLQQGALEWERAVEVTEAIAAALDYAHGNDVVHRDVKPGNVLLGQDGRIMLGDFGVVKALESGTITTTLSGGVLGTPAYVAPEIWNGEKATPGSDVYSLACLVFEMVTGRKLFDAPTPPATMTLHFRPPQFPEAWPEGTPPGLGRVLQRALAREVSGRYGSAGDFARAMATVADDPLAESYAELQAALSGGQWEEAVDLAEGILGRDPHYRDAPELLAQATERRMEQEREAWVVRWRAEAEGALEAGDGPAALAAAQQWRRMAPEDAEARAALEQARVLVEVAEAEDAATAPAAQVGPERQEAIDRSAETQPSRVASEPVYRKVYMVPERIVTSSLSALATWLRRVPRWAYAVAVVVGIVALAIYTFFVGPLAIERLPVAPEPTDVPAEEEMGEVQSDENRTPVPEMGDLPAEPVTLNLYALEAEATLDPQRAESDTSVDLVENLFVRLMGYDEESQEYYPQAMEAIDVSDDGQTYTFLLRADIPWVKYDADSGEIRQEADGEGNPRFVTAGDFVQAFERACNRQVSPIFGSYLAPVVTGCQEIYDADAPANVSQELLDGLGATAVDEGTLVVDLAFPAGYFPALASRWTLAAVPGWAVEQHGSAWAEPDNLVTSGRFTPEAWTPGEQISLLRNPGIPADLAGGGNVERVVVEVVSDPDRGYALWHEEESVDASVFIPEERLDTLLESFPESTILIADPTVFYVGFRTSKPPFDNAGVRRAFSAAIDRARFVEDVRRGAGFPMIHFAPPHVFGAPPIDEVGAGFDSEYAREQLAAAGYEECQGFPQVTLLGSSEELALTGMAYARGQWAEHLGCDPDQIQIEQTSFEELLDVIGADTPDEEAPHMWVLGWASDYADENNWVGDLLWCETADSQHKRPCTETDELIVQARNEPDLAHRRDIYHQIEAKFFGPEGEMPLAPIFLGAQYEAQHVWLDRGVPVQFGGARWYDWIVDWEAKQAAR